MKILAVDDDLIMLEILSGVIEVAGYQNVTLASSAKDALEHINRLSSPYDCLLLDIQMPEMDGIQLCEKIRAIAGYEETPIIMVTAMSETRYIDAAFVAGATDYVTKPFDVLELSTRIKMSERLIESRKEIKAKAAQVARTQNELNAKYRNEYAHPFNESDIQGLVEHDGFEQRLSRLSKRELLASSVYAIKVTSANEIFNQLLASDLKHLIQELTTAIIKCLATNESFVAYRGNGIFVCIGNRANRNSGINLENNLHSLVNDIAISEPLKGNRNVRVSIGKSKHRTLSPAQPITMIAEAIEGAERQRHRAVA